jgi:NhaC family Na+:H+ antiporter
MATTLGVATGAYLPFCFLNILNPMIGMIYGFLGFTVTRKAPPHTPGGGEH